jgi:hypothetical protein
LPSDQVLLTNVFRAHKQTHALPHSSKYPDFPRIEHSCIHTLHNEYEERYKWFINYCQLIPEFNRLSIDDKKHLLQNHLLQTIIISHRALTKDVSNILITSLKNVYGPILSNEVKQVVERIFPYTYDPIILKLVLIIETLSSCVNRYNSGSSIMHIYDDPLVISAGQNVYVELLCRYLLSRLPSERDVVKFFNKLVLDLLLFQRISLFVERHVSKLDHEIDQMNPLMQSLWHM